jgi:REP element-mobilizing transposase RayT
MFQRKRIRLPSDRYKRRVRCFLTLCTDERQRFFENDEIAKWLLDELQTTAEPQQFLLHSWCVMPDHLHLLIEGAHDCCDVLLFMSRLKQRTSYEAKRLWNLDLWQGRFYDHFLREQESFSQVASYIWFNPVRAGLCAYPREYPHSGSATMNWKEFRAIGSGVAPAMEGTTRRELRRQDAGLKPGATKATARQCRGPARSIQLICGRSGRSIPCASQIFSSSAYVCGK